MGYRNLAGSRLPGGGQGETRPDFVTPRLGGCESLFDEKTVLTRLRLSSLVNDGVDGSRCQKIKVKRQKNEEVR